MSLLTVVPNGAGAQTQHQRNAGSSNWSAAASDDGDTTYLYNLTGGGGGSQFATDLYAMGNSGGQIGVIDQIQVNVKARYQFFDPGGVAQVNPLLRLGTTNYGPGFLNLTPDYATYSYARTTHPGTGLPFSWTNVDAHQAGFSSLAGDAGMAFTEVRITHVWTVVTFHLVLRPTGLAAVGAVAQQPELRLHVIMTPSGAAGVPVAAQQPEVWLHVIMTPAGPAVVPVAVQQPDLRLHVRLFPEGAALVPVAAQQPGLGLHLLLVPEGVAVVSVAAQQPMLRFHLLMTPEGAAVVPVSAADAALLIGLAPALGRDPRAVFDLRLRGTGELALSLKRAHVLFLDLKRAGVIEEEDL